MIKIPPLYKKNPANLALVINEVNPGCEWALNAEGWATRKFDGTAAAIIDGVLYKRYDVKKGRQVPDGAIPCQEPDVVTGHWPHWVKVDERNPEDKYFIEAWKNRSAPKDGTYELIGPKINGNKEKASKHVLVRHGIECLTFDHPWLSFEGIREVLLTEDIEGFVFHHREDGRMCKIRKSDYGIKR